MFAIILNIGVDYSAKDLMIDNERRIMLMIWDTSGKREKVSLTSMFYQGKLRRGS